MGFEINKIIAAVLITIFLVFGIGKISDVIFKTKNNVVAYKVEINEKSSSDQAQAGNVDISAFLALGNIDHGK